MKSSTCDTNNTCNPVPTDPGKQHAPIERRGEHPFAIKMLITIVDRGKGQGVADLLNKEGVLFHTIMRGWGTAHKDMLDFLGLSETEKDVVISTVRFPHGIRTLRHLTYSMQLDGPGRGIAFTVPITSVGGGRTLAYLKGAFEGNDEKEMANKQEVKEMENHEHSLIITIVNRGFTDPVVDAANEAGARGGTVLHARGAGMQEAEKFFGITIQPEKEVVLTLVRQEHRAEIMKAICREAGLGTPGHGFSFSVPVEDVMGMARMITEDDDDSDD